MTTSVLRRELEEARQRAGDAEERAAQAERQCNWRELTLAEARVAHALLRATHERILDELESVKRLAEERLTLLHELQDELERLRLPKAASMRAVIRELDATKDALKSERAKNDLLDRELCRVKIEFNSLWQGRALEARDAVSSLYHAMHGDDQPRRDGLERARKMLVEWGML